MTDIDDLREIDGSHPVWCGVKFDSNERSKWDLYIGK